MKGFNTGEVRLWSWFKGRIQKIVGRWLMKPQRTLGLFFW